METDCNSKKNGPMLWEKMTKNYDFFVFPFDKILLYLSFRVPGIIKDDWDWEYLVSFSNIKSELSFDQKKGELIMTYEAP